MDTYQRAEALLQDGARAQAVVDAEQRLLAWQQCGNFAAVLFTAERSDGAASYQCVRLERSHGNWAAYDDSRDRWLDHGFERPSVTAPALMIASHAIELSETEAVHTIVFMAARGVDWVAVKPNDARSPNVDRLSGAGVAVAVTPPGNSEVVLYAHHNDECGGRRALSEVRTASAW